MKELPVIIVKLVHIQGPLMGQIQEFTEPRITIGRHTSCQVQFPTDLTSISRNHAEILREGNRFKIVDRSTNGTFVNGKRISEAFLKDGDVIMFTEGGPKMSYLAEITDAVRTEPLSEPPAPKPEPPAEPIAPEPAAAPVQPVAPSKPATPVEPAFVPPPVAPTRPAALVEPAAPAKPAAPVSKAAPGAPVIPAQEQPNPAAQPRQTVQKVQVPLIIQFGPMLKSYKELPVVIGKKADADFMLNHMAIVDQHAQIFFNQNTYWVRDLTGRNLVSVNSMPIGFEAPLKAQDIISLAPGGPALRFLGEGRLAEYEAEPAEEASSSVKPVTPAKPEPAKKEKKSKSIFDIFKK
jgi:pSer/pThr/pTyr-binding forkhead associated (FHA) protein